MEIKIAYELNFRDLSPLIAYSMPGQANNLYQQAVFLHLQLKDRFCSKEELIKKYGKATVEEVITQYPDRFIFPTDETIDRVYDTWTDLAPETTDMVFNTVFVFRLRLMDLFDTKPFLNYHLERYFDGNVNEYLEFLKLTVRKWDKMLLDEKYTNTVNEWIEKHKNTEIKQDNRKRKVKREIDDKLTSMNQETTVLFMHYIRKARLILKDEYLNNTEAGEAFSILTGYSAETIRQKLGQVEAKQLRKPKLLKELQNQLQKVVNAIDDDLRDRK